MPTDDSSHEPSDDQDSSRQGRSDWAKAGIIGAMGIELVGFVAAGLFVGRWIDTKFGIEPLGLFIGLLAALAGAGVHLWKMVNRLMPDDDDST